MITTIPFSERLSEHWLLERTYHAQLRNGRELSVANLTLAMKQLIDFFVPNLTAVSEIKIARGVAPLEEYQLLRTYLHLERNLTGRSTGALSSGIPHHALWGAHVGTSARST